MSFRRPWHLCSLILSLALVWPAQASGQEIGVFEFLRIGLDANQRKSSVGTGSPESVVTGAVGDRYWNISNGQVWRKATGSGTTGWVLTEVTPCGATGDVQINTSAAFGCDTGLFTYNTTTHTLGVNNIASQIGTALTVAATAPTGGAGSAAGVALTMSASNATIGSGAGYSAGGAVTLTAGNAVGQTSGSASGGAVTITAGGAAGASGTTPSGGALTLTAGTGVSGLNSPAGAVNITGGSGGQPGGPVNITGGATSYAGSTAGAVTISGGTASGGTNTAGSVTIKSGDIQYNKGAVTITTGSIPSQVNTLGTMITVEPATPALNTVNSGVVGGGVRIASGPGQAINSGLTAGAGGALTLVGGVGGINSRSINTTLSSGAGGGVSITAGAGADATGAHASGVFNGGAGGTVTVKGGLGGSATGASGTRNGADGGSVVLDTGAAGTGASANGTVGTLQFKINTTEYGRFHTDGSFRLTGAPLTSAGTVPGISGCSAGTQTGGAVGGTFASGTTGTCAVTLTFAVTATTGYSCFAQNVTDTTQYYRQSGGSTTTATFTGTTTSGDVIRFFCFGY